MRTFRSAASPTGAALLVGLGIVSMFVALWATGWLEGADHAEAPGVVGDPQADINDLYAFRSPENNDNLVVVLTVNPLTAPPENETRNFATDVAYEIHVDNTGDLIADATVTVTFGGDPMEFTLTIAALGIEMSGPVTPPSDGPTAPDPIITESGGIKVFAGQRDDPFFFDLVGYQNFVAAPFVSPAGLRPAGETPSDTLAGLNVSAIVIELPITALTGQATSDTGVVRAWATTSRGGVRVDRMAIPAINTAAVPSGSKDTFNQGDPVNDVDAFLTAATETVQGLRDAVNAVLGAEDGGPLGDVSAAGVAATVLPDVVTIDFSKPVDFPNLNGRTLTDDVIDIALALVLNRTVGDAIDANDVPFLSTFPFLAPPHQPAVVVSLPLPSGLSLVGWFGRPTTSAEILAGNSAILKIWTFDSSAGQYVLDTEELPSVLRPTIAITQGTGFFVLTSGSTTLEVPLP